MSDSVAKETLGKLQEVLELAKRYKAENEHLEKELEAAIKNAQQVMSLLDSEMKLNKELEKAYVALKAILTRGSNNLN
jgi:Trp operon repressor